MQEYYSETKRVLPLIALRGLWIFPHMVIHFDVGREKSLKSLDEALLQDSEVLLCSQKDLKVEDPKEEDIYPMGTIAVVKQTLKLPNGTTRVLVEGINRAKIEELREEDGYFVAEATEYIYNFTEELVDDKVKAGMRLVLDDVKEYINYNPHIAGEILLGLMDIEDPARLCDVIASYIQLKMDDHFEILEALDVYDRLEKLHIILRKEIELLKIEDKINKKVKRQIDKMQRDYYLKEQLNVIKSELGEGQDADDYIGEYEEKLAKKKLPKEAKEAALKEIKRLKSLPASSPEVNVSRSFLDYLLDLPWGKLTKDKIDLKNAREVLDNEHYGLKDVKERVLEYLAVLKKTKSLQGPILCLVGPPGVGKTSIARSIANSMGRKFVSMRLGGVRDEAEIRGHRKTYIGAMPGRIISLMTKSETMNPVFLLDEIDKLASDFRGDPASALLEVLDPEQNDEFTDHFLEVPVDLSKVVFVTTANSISTIPRALLDRMELIRVSGYTHEEKLHILKDHLLPKELKKHGLAPEELEISDKTLALLITAYTRESGVRELERMIAKVIRRAALKILEDNLTKVRVTRQNIENYAGKIKYRDDAYEKEAQLGLVTGLAWTEVGGEILQIEVGTMPGTGKIQLTGQLGDVMKESAMAGFSYIRANAEKLGVKEKDFFKNTDIHIHIPEGAIPKDGPSAGISMTTAMVSALSKRKVKASFAMTGEITLRGRVLAIGGLKEKVLAAHRYGIKNIILPMQNKKDLEEIPEKIRRQINFYPVEDIGEVLERVLEKEEVNED